MNDDINKSEDLWGPIDIKNIEAIACIKNKTAVEKDVFEGKAVFFIEGSENSHRAIDLDIPSKAYQIDSETGEKTLVVIIQAEHVNGDDLMGVRYVDGGRRKKSGLRFWPRFY